MLVLKRLVTILVMVYLLFVLLILLSPAVRTSMTGMSPTGETGFYFALFLIAAVLLGLQLITENIDSVLLRRTISQHEGKVNELKAKLYDHQLEQRDRESNVRTGTTTARPPVVVEPTRPVFPQPDPSLSNAPIETPNTIIPPASSSSDRSA